MRRVAMVATLVVAAPAHASPWNVTAEAGAEVDNNVERVETGPGLDTTPVTSPIARFGARVDHKDELFGGAYALDLSNLTRIAENRDVSVEDVTLLAGDMRWLHPIGDRPVAMGIGLTAADAFPIDDEYGDRTFRNLGADLLVTAHSGDDRRLTLGFGLRQFIYKPLTEPVHLFDWSGPVVNGRFDFVLWQPAEHTRSLELATTFGFEARTYTARAYADGCPPDATPDPSCSASTDLARHDRASHAGVELTYAGREILSLGYQLTVIDSNSYGNSFARHRVMASGTVSIGAVYVSLLAILQIDQYLDGLLVQNDLVHAEFTNIEDENRSSAQLHVARKVSPEWTVEGRVAYWRNIAGDTMDLAFSRAVVYAGMVYNK